MTRRQILDSSKLKDFADNNLKLEGNGGKLFKPVKTLWEKEKLLIMSIFSFSQCFQKVCFPGVSKGIIVWEWVKQREVTFKNYIVLNFRVWPMFVQ